MNWNMLSPDSVIRSRKNHQIIQGQLIAIDRECLFIISRSEARYHDCGYKYAKFNVLSNIDGFSIRVPSIDEDQSSYWDIMIL